ncbi:MAG: hypothetical protein AAGF47_08810 [Planctomycetota bacterium]
MVPSAADIARYRHIAAACLRGVGLLVMLYSVARLGGHVYSHFDRFLNMARGTQQADWLIVQTVMPAALLLFSIAAVFFPRLLARWIVPAWSPNRCPACGFSLVDLASDLCPECGVHLGPAFRSGQVKADASNAEQPSRRGSDDGGGEHGV